MLYFFNPSDQIKKMIRRLFFNPMMGLLGLILEKENTECWMKIWWKSPQKKIETNEIPPSLVIPLLVSPADYQAFHPGTAGTGLFS